MYSIVLFDLDGTLLDTLGDLAAAGNHTLRSMHLPTHSLEAYRHMVGNGVGKLVERMLPENLRGGATQDVAMSIFSQYYAANMQNLTQPYPGIPALLRQLEEAGVRMGVVSNKSDEYVRPIVEKYFPNVFEAVTGFVAGKPPKPDPELVFAMLRDMDAIQDAVLYVGDSDVDVHTAHNAGLKCCGVGWGFRGEAELAAAGADFLAADAEKLARIILE